MKVVEKFSKELTVEYPCLKVTTMPEDNSTLVVLFISKNIGTVLKTSGKTYDLGSYDNRWAEEDFAPYTGTLEISNGDI